MTERDDDATQAESSGTDHAPELSGRPPLDNRWALSGPSDESLHVAVPLQSIEEEIPQLIGRYAVQRRLGRGGFGEVYLAIDQDLDRYVAIKVPRTDRFTRPQGLLDLLEEAKKTAAFDHPGIVRVYDVQREPGFVYLVEQYIDGMDLGRYAKSHYLSSREIAELLLNIADAVAYAHERGFIHRDLKPSNILMDHRGRPFVADFGLAVHLSATGALGGQLAGTYPYMSPEQVRGESHRLDRRSDIWSLGVILYQLLTKRLPFRGDSREELLSSITEDEPAPPYVSDPTLSGELSRICLCCLEKRASDRFQTVDELMADLRCWLDAPSGGASADSSLRTTHSDEIETFIEPQGLRTFEARHANFYLELLPGPHDREGLPASVRFWKTRLESTVAEESFSVGLMYGPSGCGKSSLLRAGIIPRLSDQILPLVVDASAGNTLESVAAKLLESCPELVGFRDLTAMIGHLREARGSDGRKVVILLDQFEQFLHSHDDESQEQLALALRQADGVAVQALILARDDFYGSINRFFNRLEVPMMEGRNAVMVDQFGTEHARRVLAAYGRAFGKIPAAPATPAPEQVRFLDRALEGLAESGRVSCVRLSIFAEMLKSRPWTERSLRDLGGIQGVGVNFLQEQFCKSGSPPLHRLHQDAVRRVLNELISTDGSSLKGPVRSYRQLLDASGYRDHPRDFDVVMQILDRDLRLITATESTRGETTDASTPEVGYQLAHDYLSQAVRSWLRLHQLETRRGRAQLRLEQRAAAFTTSQERRNLPSLFEFLNIRLLTDSNSWNASHRDMMRRAGRMHLTRTGLFLVLTLSLGAVASGWAGRQRAEKLTDRLLIVEPEQVQEVLGELGGHPWSESVVSDRLDSESSHDDLVKKVKLMLALGERTAEYASELQRSLLLDELPYVYMPMIIDALRQCGQEAIPSESADRILLSPESSDQQQFRVRLVSAIVNPNLEGWTNQELRFLAQHLIGADPEQQRFLRDGLRPARRHLREPLLSLFAIDLESDAEQTSLARAIADYYQDDAETLCRAISAATPLQFRILWGPFAKLDADDCRDPLLALATTREPSIRLNSVQLGKQRAGAAVALLHQGFPDGVPAVLSVDQDAEALTQFVHGCRSRNVTVQHLYECLDRFVGFSEDPATIATPSTNRQDDHLLYGLLLALGEFDRQEVPETLLPQLIKQVALWYRHHPSSGVHGAAGWLLRSWGEYQAAREVDETAVAYQEGREWFTIRVDTNPLPDWKGGRQPKATFYLTFVVFESGGFEVGSPSDEIGFQHYEKKLLVSVPYRFAILDRELTTGEITNFRNFAAGYRYPKLSSGQPYGGMSWYDSVRFVRWLGEQMGRQEDEQAYPKNKSLNRNLYPSDPIPAAEGGTRNWPVYPDRIGFRLPMEPEWETACRAGTETTWSFGSDSTLLDRYAWCANRTRRTRTGRSLRPNLRGLFDMHGNRAEWCHNYRGLKPEYPRVEMNPSEDPQGDLRAVRGGSYRDWEGACRSASRGEQVPSRRPETVGLRPVMTIPRNPVPQVDPSS